MSIRNGTIVVALFSAICLAVLPTTPTFTNSNGINFKRISSGSFRMGYEGGRLPAGVIDGAFGDSLPNGIFDETPACSVFLSRDFYIGTHEVTLGQYKQYNPAILTRYENSNSNRGDGYPVAYITWQEADSFCQWLTLNDAQGYRYRLPTEAEWEYSCRAGTTTRFSCGDAITTTQAWWNDPNQGWDWLPTWTGSKPANPWGLYDMHGNVEEWCLDYYGPYTATPKTNPGGYVDADFKVTRSMGGNNNTIGGAYAFLFRSAMRGGFYLKMRLESIGFRVVISELTKDSLAYLPAVDTLAPWQQGVTQSRPTPGTTVSGSIFTDSDGRVFNRISMRGDRERNILFTQRDTVVYVSALPLVDASVTDRRTAGLFVQALSVKFGVQYRIANKYEVAWAGVKPLGNQYYITILPDIQYSAGKPHPDVAYYQERRLQAIPYALGPLYSNWQVMGNLGECPNGDLLASWYTDIAEDNFVMNGGVARLKYGTNTWGQNGVIWDEPGRLNGWVRPYIDDRGRLTQNYNMGRVSTDNGVHWTRPVLDGSECVDPAMRLNGDTLMCPTWDGYLNVSFDNGRTWTFRKNTSTNHGAEAFHHMFLDDGTFLMMTRGGIVDNTLGKWTTKDQGLSWGEDPSPFVPNNAPGNHTGLIKLHSGRIINFTNKKGDWYTRILGESVDNAQSWFVRRTTPVIGYVDIIQGRDGIIHIIGDDRRSSGDNLQASFSEEWLREAACQDVAIWGVNTAGTLTDCVNGAHLEPAYFDSLPSKTEQQNQLRFMQAYLVASPNPFGRNVEFNLVLPGLNSGTLVVHDISGKLIRTWQVPGGGSTISWDGRNASNAAVPAGCYLVRITAANRIVTTGKVLMMK